VILLTAATGQIGSRAARDLLARGHRVRALVRDPARAAGLVGAELVVGSFEDDVALARAVDGVETMLLAGRDGPDSVAQHGRVLAHARRAGVRQVVKLSAIGARADSPIALMQEHQEVDEMVAASGIAWTLIRPHLFLQNLLRAAAVIRRDGVLGAPMGAGRYPLVDTRDIGSVCAAVLAAPARHAGLTHRLTGPEAVSYDDVAHALAAVALRDVRYVAVDPAEQEERLIAAGNPGWRAFDLAHIASGYRPEDHVVTDTIESLLGGPATDLETFVRDHAETFGPAVRLP
jgi:uncharacterized protein YbjT (DUF2867 family)